MVSYIVTYLYEDEQQALKLTLIEAGYPLKEAECSTAFFQVKTPKLSLSLYRTGRLLLQGDDTELFLHSYLEELVARRYTIMSIGTDESGKGDYFGPLVVAAVRISRFDVETLLRNSVQDSKAMADSSVVEVAKMIAEAIPHKVIVIGNKKYNELYEKIRNVNQILVWAHATAAEALILPNEPQRIIIDRFSNPVHLQSRLKEHKNIDLIQVENGERELPVAAASILARAEFLSRLKNISKRFGFEFPKGAGANVLEAGREFIKKFGRERLGEVAKLHFKTTQKISQ